MTGYFSFERLITAAIVKALYFFGFLILTSTGLTLTVWAGLRLHDANISRQLGWRYVAVGLAAIVIGNLAWRVICELWIVLFNINDQLASRESTRSLRIRTLPETQLVERRRSALDRRVVTPESDSDTTRAFPAKEKEGFKNHRPAGVLGLS